MIGWSCCPGCGLAMPAERGDVARGVDASPACAAVFAEVCGFGLQRPPLDRFHQLATDTYTAQHGREGDNPRLLHALTGLYLAIEHGRTASEVLSAQHALGRPVWPPLTRPRTAPTMTVIDVAERGLMVDSVIGHAEALYAWADSLWAAWEPHHADVAAIAREHLGGFITVPQRICFGFRA
ncbi:DUF5946 family protein [Nocardia sp. NPDC003693]